MSIAKNKYNFKNYVYMNAKYLNLIGISFEKRDKYYLIYDNKWSFNNLIFKYFITYSLEFLSINVSESWGEKNICSEVSSALNIS